MANSFMHIKWPLLALLFSLFSGGNLHAQYGFVPRENSTPKIDTLFLTHRSGGEHIDSLDKAYYDHYLTLFNLGRGYLPQFRDLKTWGSHRHYFSDERPIYRADYHFTALPYTGFFYSFGSGGEQVLDLRYTQNVGKHFNLSFRYHRTSSDPVRAGFLMRNIETQSNDVSLNLHYHKKRLNSFFTSYYSFDNYRENFGLTPPWSLIDSLGLALAQVPVNNSEANVRIRRMQFNLRNEYALVKDSTQSLQVVSNIGLHNFQRRYQDTLTSGSFDNWIYDSTNTRDLWEEPHFLTDLGLKWSYSGWKIYGGFQVDYFSYFNAGFRANRLDGILLGQTTYEKGRLQWKNNLRFFVFGTPGEFSLTSRLKFQLTDKIQIGASALQERIFPEFFQLHFSGNHLAYDNTALTISPTTRTYLEGSIQYGQKNRVKISGAFLSVQNMYAFQTNSWIFNVNQNVFVPELSWQLRKGALAWNVRAQYYLGEKSSFFAPDYFASTRLFLDGALFKAKRLKVATGVELQYFNGNDLMAYHPEIGVFGLPNFTSDLPQQNMLLNVFVNLQMDRFRFFLAANRINTLFEKPFGSLVEHYPIRPFYIRMGITWDFVN